MEQAYKYFKVFYLGNIDMFMLTCVCLFFLNKKKEIPYKRNLDINGLKTLSYQMLQLYIFSFLYKFKYWISVDSPVIRIMENTPLLLRFKKAFVSFCSLYYISKKKNSIEFKMISFKLLYIAANCLITPSAYFTFWTG